jgi:AcrR family transcriptional regulator
MFDLQRARILAAMAEVACERGAANVTVAHVVTRSGVSRRTFYELFADREDCFIAAFDEAVERVAAPVVSAYRRPGRWQERIRAALTALLAIIDEEPKVGRLTIVEALAAGPRALEHRRGLLTHAVAAVAEGHTEVKSGKLTPSPLAAEGVVGAVLSVLYDRLLDTPSRSLLELAGPLMALIVLPYRGNAAAQRELERPPPQISSKAQAAAGDLLQELDIRLTYRTLRVLLAIGSHPEASNRRVAEEAGIADQGQVSKLLARLETRGLIENLGEGPFKGVPNAWTLTGRGQEIERAIERQTGA